jgi:hypothetical protein
MIARALLLATALIAASSATAVAQIQETFANRNVIAAPVLRANVQVSGDLVRIGDVDRQCRQRRADRDLPRARIWAPRARCRSRRCSTPFAPIMIGVDTAT